MCPQNELRKCVLRNAHGAENTKEEVTLERALVIFLFSTVIMPPTTGVSSKPVVARATRAKKVVAEPVSVVEEVAATPARKPAGKKAPPAPKSPVAVEEPVVVPATKTASRKKAGTKPAADPAEEPLALDAAPTAVTRAVAPPMSPRAASAVFTASRKNAAPLSLSEAKQHALALSRSVIRGGQISRAVLASKNGEYRTGDKSYTKADLKDMDRATAQAISRMHMIFKAASSRHKETLSDEERTARRDALIERAREGAEILAESSKIPRLADVIYEKAVHEIDSKAKLSKLESSKQITSQFYVTDQFVNFVRTGNFGNGLALLFPNVSDATHAIPVASDKLSGTTEHADAAIKAVEKECAGVLKGQTLLQYLDTDIATLRMLADPRWLILTLLSHNVVTSPLLMTIMARYAKVNNLTDPETKRINFSKDKNMRQHFGPGTNSRWFLGGVDYTPTEETIKAAPEAERAELREIMENANLSIYDRLLARKPKKKDGSLPFDGKSYERSIAIVIPCMCHIKIMTDEKLAEKLRNPKLAALTVGINIYI